MSRIARVPGRAIAWPWKPHDPVGASLIDAAKHRLFGRDAEFRHYGRRRNDAPLDRLADFIFAVTGDPVTPAEAFERLRWGGQFVFVSESFSEANTLVAKFRDRRGFIVEREPEPIATGPLGMYIPGLSRRGFAFSARKIQLVPPGRTTDRFTYQVELARHPLGEDGYAVLKQVPDFEQVVARLTDRFPEATIDTVVKNARKLVDKVFPVFLTREAAFLAILQRELPEPYRSRVPRVFEARKDSSGFVRQMVVEWLRNGGRPMSQLQFARQSADLLRVLHDTAGIMHLDLRLDNFVITPLGVGFIDFGSAVRIGENLAESPMLRTLFDEMMTTSQIQRDLGRMKKSGRLTSRIICDGYQKVDKAVDLFYLALQMNEPHHNPDFEGLIRCDSHGEEARLLLKLTHEVLKPSDPDHPRVRCAKDLLTEIDAISAKLSAQATEN